MCYPKAITFCTDLFIAPMRRVIFSPKIGLLFNTGIEIGSVREVEFEECLQIQTFPVFGFGNVVIDIGIKREPCLRPVRKDGPAVGDAMTPACMASSRVRNSFTDTWSLAERSV